MTAQKQRPQPTATRKGPTGKRKAPTGKGGNRWIFPAVVIGVVLVGILAVVLVASGGGDDSSGGGTDAVAEISENVTTEGTALPRYTGTGTDPAVGMEAPTLASIDFDGNPATAGGATGSPYALVFLAHYCPHCQAEVPRLVNVARNGTIEGVEVIGIPTATTSEAPNYPPSEWLAEEDWPFPILLDDDAGSAAQAYGLSAYPFMVFVDADGAVAGRISGEVSEADLEKVFRALAAGKALPLPGVGASSRS